MRRLSCLVGLSLLATPLAAQETDLRSQVGELVGSPHLDPTLASLDTRFVEEVLMLLPDLPPEDVDVLAGAAGEAFAPEALRARIVDEISRGASSDFVDRLLAMRRSGSQAELNRLEEGFEATETLEEHVAALGADDRARVQLMAALVEARRSSELSLVLDEALRGAAHGLVRVLGADVGDFEPLSEDLFQAAYRDRTLRLALEADYALRPATEELLAAVVEEHRSEPGAWYTEAYLTALVSSVRAAANDVAAMTVPQDVPETAGGGVDESGLLCFAHTCGFVVEWEGPEPSGSSQVYGSPGDLEQLALTRLLQAGYSLMRGPAEDGMTIRLRARAANAYCEVVSGTNNRTCAVVGQVRVDFTGEYPGLETPGGFLVRNRCGANSVMGARGIAALVAARINYVFTTFEGDDRNVPSC